MASLRIKTMLLYRAQGELGTGAILIILGMMSVMSNNMAQQALNIALPT